MATNEEAASRDQNPGHPRSRPPSDELLEATVEELNALVRELQDKNQWLKKSQRAFMNIMEDLHEERSNLKKSHQAFMNVMEDLQQERAQLIEANAKLEEKAALEAKNQYLEQFVRIASHDLQEPLRTISNFTRLLAVRSADKLSDQENRFIQFIAGAAERMTQLITGLQEHSAIGRKAHFTHLECQTLVSEVIDDLATSIEESGARIEFNDLPTVYGYALELRQLFQNLIGNAIKFRKLGRAPEIIIISKRQHQRWLFSIRDNGIGFDMQASKAIFDIFHRLHSRKAYSGTGIGLSLCQKIVEMHGGEIWATSEIDKGSTFHFTIADSSPLMPLHEDEDR